jgi:ferrous iron transport protein B
MALELPTYKLPSLRTAFLTTFDRSLMFLKNAGTNILAICVVLWWMGNFPRVSPPPEAVELHAQADAVREGGEGAQAPGPDTQRRADELVARALRLEASNAKAHSYAGILGKFIQPVFEPLGYDWQLTVGVLTSFAAREVFVSTMAVMVAGTEDKHDPGVVKAIQEARRSDGVTPIFTTATSWSLLVFYVLAMQCLPTLAVTAKEAGGVRWAFLQLAWMSGLAYIAAFAIYRLVLAVGG